MFLQGSAKAAESGYRYLEEEEISLKYGVKGIVEKKREAFEQTHRRCTVLGVAVCIMSVFPLLTAGILAEDEMYYIGGLAALLLLVALGVCPLVWSGRIYNSFSRLLQEGEYTKEKKEARRRMAFLNAVYWAAALAVLMIMRYSRFYESSRMNVFSVFWVIAVLLYIVVRGILGAVAGRERTEAKERK